jgi:hypothetical protein
MLTTVLLIVVLSSLQTQYTQAQQRLNNLVCAKSYSEQNRSIETTFCRTFDSKATAKYQCGVAYTVQIPKDGHEPFSDALDIRILFSGVNSDNIPVDQLENNTEIFFEWFKISHGQRSHAKSLGNRTLALQRAGNSSLDARLILYDIVPDTLYRVCAAQTAPSLIFPDSPEDFCCEIEQLEVEETDNIFMVVVVVGIVFLIYFIVVMVHWKCQPSAFNSIDEILGTLPSAHVEKLKKMIVEQEECLSAGDNMSETGQETDTKVTPVAVVQPYTKNSRSAKNRRASVATFRSILDTYDNRGYESGDEVTSVTSKNKQTVVKFADESNVIDDLDELGRLKLKVLKESKRRASINPFKKTYALNVSSEEEESDD